MWWEVSAWIRYMTENGINASRPTPRTKTGISNLDRSHLSRILENPLYVRADKEVYRYFLSKGYEMLDDKVMRRACRRQHLINECFVKFGR